jgi:hypothetical protein
MRINFTTKTFALLSAMLVTSCAEQDLVKLAEPDVSPYEQVDFKLLINGRSLSEFTSEEEVARFVSGLEEEGTDNERLSLAERIELLLSQKEGKGELGGLAGIPSRTALEAFRLALDDRGRFVCKLEADPPKGQIQASVDGEPGFYFKPGEPMHIWVQITTTFRCGDRVLSKAEMYRVLVPANQAVVERRAGTGASVFPGFENVAFAVPASMADRVDNGVLTQFQYKLWADGTDVEVTNYWLDPAYDPANGPQWKKYTPANAPASLQGIFQTDADSCFDMLFKFDPTLETAKGGALENGRLPPGSKPPYYCLGRCTDPMILNTN